MDDGGLPELDERRQLIGKIIDYCNDIEGSMKLIISEYLQPPEGRSEFLTSIVLHNSVLPLGGKIKVILAIDKQEQLGILDKNQLHRLLAIRNMFAHSDADAIDVRDASEPDADEADLIFVSVVESLSSGGDLRTMDRADAHREFFRILEGVDLALNAMYVHLRDGNSLAT